MDAVNFCSDEENKIPLSDTPSSQNKDMVWSTKPLSSSSEENKSSQDLLGTVML